MDDESPLAAAAEGSGNRREIGVVGVSASALPRRCIYVARGGGRGGWAKKPMSSTASRPRRPSQTFGSVILRKVKSKKKKRTASPAVKE